jgi:PHD/YefM family antitoxin component YafN of YafNO toxin-antitoxin module
MRQNGWVLRTGSNRQRIGLIRAKEWERKSADEELLLPHQESRAKAPGPQTRKPRCTNVGQTGP